jgi:hypothetical protein
MPLSFKVAIGRPSTMRTGISACTI